MKRRSVIGRGVIAAALGSVLLGGCGLFGRSDTTPPPLPATVGGVSPRVAWTVPVGPGGNGFQPAATGQAVFAAAADGTVVRVDAASGRVAWRVSAGRALGAGAGSDGTVVAVASREGDVIALDAETGRIAWTASLGAEVLSTPSVGAGAVVVRAGDRIVALDAVNGSRRWAFQRPSPALVLRQPAPVAITAQAVYAGLPGGRLVALSADTGAIRWEAAVAQPRGTNEIERIVDVLGRPQVSGREVCAAAYQGRVACFDAATGAPVWSRDVPAWGGTDVDGRFAFAPDDRGALHALRRDTGEPAWRQDALALRRLSPPLSSGASVLVGDRDGLVHWFARDTGAPQARRSLDAGAITAAPAAAGNLAVVQTARGTLFALATD